MNFLLDVNASGAVAIWLIQRGHGVVDCHSLDLESGAIVIALSTKIRVRK